MRAAGDAPVLHLVERAVRALVVPALGDDVTAMHTEQRCLLAAATLAGLRIRTVLAHVADATVTA